MFSNRCPICGTLGEEWDKDPDVKVCPHCFSIFSKFGIVLETQREQKELWS